MLVVYYFLYLKIYGAKVTSLCQFQLYLDIWFSTWFWQTNYEVGIRECFYKGILYRHLFYYLYYLSDSINAEDFYVNHKSINADPIVCDVYVGWISKQKGRTRTEPNCWQLGLEIFHNLQSSQRHTSSHPPNFTHTHTITHTHTLSRVRMETCMQFFKFGSWNVEVTWRFLSIFFHNLQADMLYLVSNFNPAVYKNCPTETTATKPGCLPRFVSACNIGPWFWTK